MSAHLRRVRHFLAYLRWHVDQGGRGVRLPAARRAGWAFEDWPVR